MRCVVWTAALGLLCSGAAQGQTREERVRADRAKILAEGFWIYNDLGRGFAEAKKTGKPMLIVLRCVPCVDCVKLDDDLINSNPKVRPLMEKFVCVRLVSTNGLDLGLFQFDYDQSFAAFLLNADGTIYGRYGTRSHQTYWSDDVSVEGLVKALEKALALHAEYPKNKAALAGKRGPALEFPTPEKYPQLSGKYGPTLDLDGKGIQSCIHCHQIGDAQKQLYRDRRQPMPEKVLFPYPHPKVLGLILDPRECATVLRVEKDSPAAKSGFQPGDVILTLQGQPILSIADVQWVLHQAGAASALKATVRRGPQTLDVSLRLPAGWRQREDLSWRVSTWALRRMALGGLVLETLPDAERPKLGLTGTGMALRVKQVGNWGPHAAAQNAGFRQGDIVVAFDGRTDLPRETDVLAYALNNRKAGESVPVTVLRDGRKVELQLPMQN
ncbi:MAG: PDZ domain-containing protein [Gemmataceae bacterium]|nr:PDZ domain-containing protein [Gemmataceae bacterium]MDW8264600.1 Trx7/PDZ domain-containing (seleno)protein [Gemmataceae bacterium]